MSERLKVFMLQLLAIHFKTILVQNIANIVSLISDGAAVACSNEFSQLKTL